MNNIIERVFIIEIITSIIIIIFIVALSLFIKWALKEDPNFRLILAIIIVVSILVVSVLSFFTVRTFLDIKNKDYVTYYGEYIERGGGQKDLKTIVVYDNRGNEIKLLRTGPSEEGTYYGTVVYGKRSKIIVEYSGIPKNE